jgi:hypothetical protein
MLNKDIVCKAPLKKGIYAIVKPPKINSIDENILWNWRLEIKIYYSPKRFDAYYKSCRDNNKLIWSRDMDLTNLSTDLAIKYTSDLSQGYYLIDLLLLSVKEKYNSKTFYYCDPNIEPYIVIGLPYSIYKVIKLKKV